MGFGSLDGSLTPRRDKNKPLVIFFAEIEILSLLYVVSQTSQTSQTSRELETRCRQTAASAAETEEKTGRRNDGG